MAGTLWIPEAEDLAAVGTSGEMEGGNPKVTVHVTVSPSGKSPGGTQYFDAMHRVLRDKKAEPHILYDPLTDRLGQYFALNRSARALANDGARRTNGAGVCNIQIEFVAQPDGFTRYWKPGPNYAAMLRAIRSWDIPDLWPAGRLSKSSGDPVSRSWTNYNKAGWFGHCNVPGNDHWDPGPIDQQALFLKSQEEDDMQLTDKVTVSLPTGTGSETITYATYLNRQNWVYNETVRQRDQITKLVAESAAQSAVLSALATKPGMTLAEITAAAKAGAAAALDERIQTAEVHIDVTPPAQEQP